MSAIVVLQCICQADFWVTLWCEISSDAPECSQIAIASLTDLTTFSPWWYSVRNSSHRHKHGASLFFRGRTRLVLLTARNFRRFQSLLPAKCGFPPPDTPEELYHFFYCIIHFYFSLIWWQKKNCLRYNTWIWLLWTGVLLFFLLHRRNIFARIQMAALKIVFLITIALFYDYRYSFNPWTVLSRIPVIPSAWYRELMMASSTASAVASKTVSILFS